MHDRAPRSLGIPLIAAVGIAALVAGLLLRPAPTMQVAPAEVLGHIESADYSVPSTLHLSWPNSGQGAIAVQGMGTIATHGPVQNPVPIASVAKTMTAYLVLRDHPLGAGQGGPVITVLPSEAAAYAHEVALNQSLVRVKSGEQLTERQALQALMLASADNVAQILGRWDAGSVTTFLAEMNAAAASLGMAHTRFTDPSGYDAGTRSTAPDLLILGTAAMANPAFAQVVAERSATIPVQGAVTNYNALLGTHGVIGIKTGSMSASGGCLLFAAQESVGRREVMLIGVVLGVRGSGSMLSNTMAAVRVLLRSVESQLTSAMVATRH